MLPTSLVWFRNWHARFRAWAAMALLLYLFSLALACSPELHHLLHHDSEQDSHQCAATLLSHGQVEKPACSTLIPVAPVMLLAAPVSHCQLSFFSSALLPPGRAPPIHA